MLLLLADRSHRLLEVIKKILIYGIMISGAAQEAT